MGREKLNVARLEKNLRDCSPLHTEIAGDERDLWTRLLLAFKGFAQESVENGMVVPKEISIPVEDSLAPNVDSRVFIRALLTDLSTFQPRALIVGLKLDGIETISGECNAVWDNGRPNPGEAQYFVDHAAVEFSSQVPKILHLTAKMLETVVMVQNPARSN